MKEGKIKEILQELRRLKDNPEAIDKFLNAQLEEEFNQKLKKAKIADPLLKNIPSKYKAGYTDNFLHEILGEMATEELEDLDRLPIEEQYKKILQTAYPEMSDLQRSINFNPNISIKDLDSDTAGFWQPSKGIVLSKKFSENPSKRKLMRGTVLHEGAHGLDDTATKVKELVDEIDKRKERPKILQFRDLNEYDPKKTYFQNMRNSEIYRYFQNVEDKLDKFKNKNPNKIEDFLDQEVLKKFDSLPYPEKFEHSTYVDKTPLELQDMYTKGHFFDRNFSRSNIGNILKKGLKGTKGIGLSLIPSLALGAAAAAYSPDSKAGTIARTAKRALDEGDPSSVLFPSEAGEGEEQELQKMMQEKKKEEDRKIKEQNQLTDDQMRRWSKIRNRLER